MQNRRYNPFNLVHKGLRAFMFDTAIKLQRTDLAGDKISIIVIDQLTQLLDTLECHANREDHFINVPIESLDPKMSNLFQREHELGHRLAVVIKNLLMDWYSAGPGKSNNSITARLKYAFNEFIAFNLDHMNKEEIELTRILWKNYSDEELWTIEYRILQSIPKQKLSSSIGWIVRSISENELILWIGALQKESPSHFFPEVLSIAEHELDSDRWDKITRYFPTTPTVCKERKLVI